MTERPIIFSGPMVRAILDGRKHQTRRVVTPSTSEVIGYRVGAKSPIWAGLKLDHPMCKSYGDHLAIPWIHPEDEANGFPVNADTLATYRVHPCMRVGSIIYVRETWKSVTSGSVDNGFGNVRYGVAYRADGLVSWSNTVTSVTDLTGNLKSSGPLQFKNKPWRPSTHMPKWAARIWLEVTGVRVERLQDISCADAIAEGIRPAANSMTIDCDTPDPRQEFRRLWDSLNAKRAPWDSNPWVWIIEFRRMND